MMIRDSNFIMLLEVSTMPKRLVSINFQPVPRDGGIRITVLVLGDGGIGSARCIVDQGSGRL